MDFKPKAKADYNKIIEHYLMNGYIIRYDFRDETPLEVMERDLAPRLHSMHNIGQENAVWDRLSCSHDIIHEVCDKLSKEYSVRKVRCSFSGCCQYTTYGVYLDGE